MSDDPRNVANAHRAAIAMTARIAEAVAPCSRK